MMNAALEKKLQSSPRLVKNSSVYLNDEEFKAYMDAVGRNWFGHVVPRKEKK